MTDEALDNTKVSESNPDYESLAKKEGWSPKESFKGDPEKWVDAETFYKRGQELNPFLKKHNKELQSKVEELQKQIETTREDAKEFRKFIETAAKREIDAKIAELEAQKAAAIESGDGTKAVQIDRDIRAAEKESIKAEKEERKTEPPPPNPVFEAWLKENPWYKDNPDMRDEADGIGLAYHKKKLPASEIYAKVRERMEILYPEAFEKTERPGPQRGSATTGLPKKKSYENLPDEAKKACDKFVKQGLFKSRDEYVAKFDWS